MQNPASDIVSVTMTFLFRCHSGNWNFLIFVFVVPSP